MEVEYLKNLAASLVREYLFRTGLKCTLKCMDDECPRSSGSVSNRMTLARELRVEHLVARHRQRVAGPRSVLEVVLVEFLRRGGGWCGAVDVDCRRLARFHRRLADSGLPLRVDLAALVRLYCDCFATFTAHRRHKSGERDEHGKNRERKKEKEARDEHVDTRTQPRTRTRTVISHKEDVLLESLGGGCRDNRTRLGPDKEDTFLDLKRPSSAEAESVISHKEDVLLESLGGGDNRTRLGPDKENTFLDLKRPSSAEVESVISHKEDVLLESLGGGDNRTRLGPDKEDTFLDLKRPSSAEVESVTSHKEDVLLESLGGGCRDNRTRLGPDKEDTFLDLKRPSSAEVESVISHKEDVLLESLGGGCRDNRTRLGPDKEDTFLDLKQASGAGRVSIVLGGGSANVFQEEIEKRILMVDDTYAIVSGSKTTPVAKADINDSDISDPDEEGDGGDSDFVPLRRSQAVALKRLILGSAGAGLPFPRQWVAQSFVLSHDPKLRYGFVQNQESGVCGVLAPVQAHLLKWLLFEGEGEGEGGPPRPSAARAQAALAAALADVLWRAGGRRRAVLVRSGDSSQLAESGGGAYRPDGLTDSLLCRRFHDEQQLRRAVENHLGEFTSPLGKGCLRFVISAILSCGIQRAADGGGGGGGLVGPGGRCSPELVHLLLTGRASARRADIGFLTSCQVGSNLKTPRLPIWLVDSDDHWSVVFSPARRLVSDWRAERRFRLFHYDSLACASETVLAIDTTGFSADDGAEKENVPALEHCIKTKWKDAIVHWSSSTS